MSTTFIFNNDDLLVNDNLTEPFKSIYKIEDLDEFKGKLIAFTTLKTKSEKPRKAFYGLVCFNKNKYSLLNPIFQKPGKIIMGKANQEDLMESKFKVETYEGYDISMLVSPDYNDNFCINEYYMKVLAESQDNYLVRLATTREKDLIKQDIILGNSIFVNCSKTHALTLLK